MDNLIKRFLLLIISIFITTTAFASNGLTYGIKPSFSQSKLDADLMAVYKQWKGDDVIEDLNEVKPDGDGYLAQYKNSGESYPIYIIKGDATGDNPKEWESYPDSDLKAASTSEATGYGMMIFALMGDKDPKAHEYFDGLLNLYLRNLSTTEVTENGVTRTLNTMSWIIPSKYKLNNGSQPARSGSACDGDLDIAYALLLADKQWGSTSQYANTNKTYKELATILIKDIRDYIISSDTYRVLMGDSYFFETKGTWDGDGSTNENGEIISPKFNHSSTRPSDWMAGHLRVFNTVVPDAKWLNAVNEIYRILPIVSNNTTFLAPDFVEDKNGTPIPGNKSQNGHIYIKNDITGNYDEYPVKVYMEGFQDDMYGNNACRVPWRIAMDYAHNGNNEALEYLKGLNTWSASQPDRLRRGGEKNCDHDGDGKPDAKTHYGWEEEHDNDWWTIPAFNYQSTFPENIASGYTLDGDPIKSKYNKFGQPEDVENWDRIKPSTDNQFVSPMGFANIIGGTGAQERLDATWTLMADKWNFGGNHEANGFTCYFGDSINLLNLFMASGNWFNPAIKDYVTKNYQNLRSKKWYEFLQSAIDESQDNDTIQAHMGSQEIRGSFAVIKNKKGLTIQTVPGQPLATFAGQHRYATGISIVDSTDITIKNVELSYFSGSLYIGETCENIVIDGVVLQYGMGGNRAYVGGKNITIKNSFIRGGSAHPSPAVRVNNVENFLFHHNVVDGVHRIASGIYFTDSATSIGTHKIYNNVFVNNTVGVSVANGHADIKNNIFIGSRLWDIGIVNGATATIDYNLYEDDQNMVDGGVFGSHKVIGNPKYDTGTAFIDDYLSYTLKTGSPAIDKGVSIPGITTETDGKADMGWKEVVNAAAPPLAFDYNAKYLDGSKVIKSSSNYIANWDTNGEIPGSAPYPFIPWDKLSEPQTIVNDLFNWGTGSWWQYYDSSAYATMYNENGVLRTDIYSGGENLWDVIVAKNVTVEKDNYYTVIFDAKTESNVKIQVLVSQGAEPYKAYSHYQEIELSSTMEQYSFTFKMDHDTDYNAKIEFDLGGEETPQDIWIDNVKLIKE